MVEKRVKSDKSADAAEQDEVQLGGNMVSQDANDDTMEETKDAQSNSETEENKSNADQRPFSKHLTRDTVQAYSRWLHRNTPENRYFKVKIPWKTIFVAFLFLIVGTVMLYIGFNELLNGEGGTPAWEKIVLGFMLFIPGSFHSFLAVQALRGVQGYDYEHLTVFENDKFFEED